MVRPTPEEAARAIREERYPSADVVLLAGSVVRGDATPSSDLDLVVLSPRLPHAHRESFVHRGWPVEAFAHDLETLAYFFTEVDGKAGRAALAHMVLEGREVPGPTALSRAAKEAARRVVEGGPPALTDDELRARRYHVTDLVDDLRTPRTDAELAAAGAELHAALADLHLRAARRWTARGKAIPRALGAVDPALALRWEGAFDDLFVRRAPGAAIRLAEELLAPLGGLLFDGYRLDAPAGWRGGRGR